LYYPKPEFPERLDHRLEALKVPGFGKIAISTESVALLNVFVVLRIAQHDGGNLAQGRVGTELRKHLQAVFAGQVQVEDDYVRAVGMGIPSHRRKARASSPAVTTWR
jgi:hypothetical protein